MSGPGATARFAPRRDQAFATGVAGLVAAALIVLADGPGRVLVGLAAVLLLALSVLDLVWVPRLTVTTLGVVVSTPGSRAQLTWDDIEAIRLDERSRLGRVVRTVEIDGGEQLIVLGRHSLGVDPAEAHALILAFDADGLSPG